LESNIVEYYSKSLFEDDRLQLKSGGNLEWIRTIDILKRFIPSAPSTILDIGGGTGVYSLWFLNRGYEVNLVDLVPSHIQAAKEKLGSIGSDLKWTAKVGDARDLDFPDASIDIVLLMGPLYHTQKSSERLDILREALRVLKPGGQLFCAIISRFASFLDGLMSGYIRDPEFRKIVEGDLQNSCHNNHTDIMEYFTTAYFQHPDELKQELHRTGFADIQIVGIEGILWATTDWAALRRDKNAWGMSLEFMRRIESDSSVIGASPHIMGIGKKPSE
jgi:ubiquinone/menaquinone biosynthesis C-methylase UbiE